MSKKKSVTKGVEEGVKVQEVKLEPIVMSGILADAYRLFVSGLSSNEQEVFSAKPAQAVHAFKRFLADMSDEDMVKNIVEEVKPELTEEEI